MQPIGVVIITYNSEAEIGACLDSLASQNVEVLVVDNASSDHTLDEVRQRDFRVIPNAENRGFAAAANQGFAALDTPLVLLLNPDSRLHSGLELLAQACELGASAAGGMLLGTDGQPQTGFMVRSLPTPTALICENLLINRVWPRNPVNWQYRCLDKSVSEPSDVEQPAGAFLMITKEVWQKLKGFDEGFFPVWFEDVDFCARILAAGGTIRYVPGARAFHAGAHAVNKLQVRTRQIYWYRSLLRYSGKHFRPWQHGAVCVSVILGSCIRALGSVITSRSLKHLEVCGAIVQSAMRSWPVPRVPEESCSQSERL